LLSSNIIADPFAVENLKANVQWSGYEWLIGLVFIGLAHFSLAKIRSGSLKFIYLLCLASLFAVYSLIMLVAPKVEQYSQRAAIDFYKQCHSHGFNIETLGFKSYATLFYGGLDASFKEDQSFKNYIATHKQELESSGFNIETSYSYIRTQWMIEGYGNKPACFIAKVIEEDVVKELYPQLQELYRQNGFIFYIRKRK